MQKIFSSEPQKLILALAICIAPVIWASSLLIGRGGHIGLVFSAVFLLIGIGFYRMNPLARNVGAAAALIGQAIALTANFAGHAWQLDTHMLFFALLACLTVLRSVTAILAATAIIAVHHLSFSVFLPALVYPGVDLFENLSRAFLHAVIVLIETGVLVFSVVTVNRLQNGMKERNAELAASVEKSDNARQEAEAAKARAEATREAAEAAQARTEQLLLEAKESERGRIDAERERTAAQEAAAADVEQNAAEQAMVGEVLRAAMFRLKTGDLSSRIDDVFPPSYKDIGLAFNEAVAALDTAVSEVARQSEDMQSQVQEIASAAANLAERTEQQAHTLRASSAGLGDLTRAVSGTEQTVKEADSYAQTAQRHAQASEKVVAETSQAMSAIQAEAGEISQIVRVIDEIAFQTNLLALNAGVEAARAGEAGRGFAVVASEVRALAQRSSDSATAIRDLIERSDQQVLAGSNKIEETVSALSGVFAAVSEITSKTQEIATGAQEQTRAISDLNRKVGDLDRTTQQNAAMFEETAAACTSLENRATFLLDLTRKFQVSDREEGRAAAAA